MIKYCPSCERECEHTDITRTETILYICSNCGYEEMVPIEGTSKIEEAKEETMDNIGTSNKDLAIEMFNAGKSRTDIARDMKVSRPTVYLWTKHLGKETARTAEPVESFTPKPTVRLALPKATPKATHKPKPKATPKSVRSQGTSVELPSLNLRALIEGIVEAKVKGIVQKALEEAFK